MNKRPAVQLLEYPNPYSNLFSIKAQRAECLFGLHVKEISMCKYLKTKQG